MDRQREREGFKAFSGHGRTLASEQTTTTTTTTSHSTKKDKELDETIKGVASNPILIDMEEDEEPGFVFDDTAPKTTIQIRFR